MGFEPMIKDLQSSALDHFAIRPMITYLYRFLIINY